MRFGSVCSGIEAASCAWHPLGWEPAWFAEIEAFPSAVLARHYPDVPNLGDITADDFTTRAQALGPIDVLIGGTPCQSFSVAGLRGGLADERGNLALRFFQIADQLKPEWIVWENVPGVLSSNEGKDFASILDAAEELGYVYDVDILDAQFFGVPQRRRRVFLVCQRGDSILKMRTTSSVLTTAQWLAEVSQNTLGAVSSQSDIVPTNSESHAACVDGLKRRMKSFGVPLDELSETLPSNLEEACQRFLPGPASSASLDGGTFGEAATPTPPSEAARLQRELAEAQQECEEQARLNGMGSEREAKLRTEVDRLKDAKRKRDTAYVTLMEDHDRLAAEVVKLRQAVGVATTAVPTMEMDADDPIGMMHRVVDRVERLKGTIKQQGLVNDDIEAEADRLRALLERVREWFNQNHRVNCPIPPAYWKKLNDILSEIDAPAPSEHGPITDEELQDAKTCLKCMGSRYVLGPHGGHVGCPECNAPASPHPRTPSPLVGGPMFLPTDAGQQAPRSLREQVEAGVRAYMSKSGPWEIDDIVRAAGEAVEQATTEPAAEVERLKALHVPMARQRLDAAAQEITHLRALLERVREWREIAWDDYFENDLRSLNAILSEIDAPAPVTKCRACRDGMHDACMGNCSCCDPGTYYVPPPAPASPQSAPATDFFRGMPEGLKPATDAGKQPTEPAAWDPCSIDLGRNWSLEWAPSVDLTDHDYVLRYGISTYSIPSGAGDALVDLLIPMPAQDIEGAGQECEEDQPDDPPEQPTELAAGEQDEEIGSDERTAAMCPELFGGAGTEPAAEVQSPSYWRGYRHGKSVIREAEARGMEMLARTLRAKHGEPYGTWVYRRAKEEAAAHRAGQGKVKS